MDIKANVKKRREERIRQLISSGIELQGQGVASENLVESVDVTQAKRAASNRVTAYSEKSVTMGLGNEFENGTTDSELDPELVWKQGRGRWKEASLFGSPEKGEVTEYDDGGEKRGSYWRNLFIRMGISLIIFIGVSGIQRFEPEWSGPVRLFIAQALTQEIDFRAAEVWYEQYFGGAPSFIPIFRHHEEKGVKVGGTSAFVAPLDGTISVAYAMTLKGIEIVPVPSNSSPQVLSVGTGRVLSVSNDAFTGQTVVVQHGDGFMSIYGYLDEVSVEKGDWVELGDLVGHLPSFSDKDNSTLYFALKKNDLYIDPTDVIPFD